MQWLFLYTRVMEGTLNIKNKLLLRANCSRQLTGRLSREREKIGNYFVKQKASLPRCFGLDASGLWGCQAASLGMLGRFREKRWCMTEPASPWDYSSKPYGPSPMSAVLMLLVVKRQNCDLKMPLIWKSPQRSDRNSSSKFFHHVNWSIQK